MIIVTLGEGNLETHIHQRRDTHVMAEAEIGGTMLQAEECQG